MRLMLMIWKFEDMRFQEVRLARCYDGKWTGSLSGSTVSPDLHLTGDSLDSPAEPKIVPVRLERFFWVERPGHTDTSVPGLKVVLKDRWS